jgi:hypothetical protein
MNNTLYIKWAMQVANQEYQGNIKELMANIKIYSQIE